MTTLRLALIAAAAAMTLSAATAQTASPPQVEQSSSEGCGFKAKPAATS